MLVHINTAPSADSGGAAADRQSVGKLPAAHLRAIASTANVKGGWRRKRRIAKHLVRKAARQAASAQSRASAPAPAESDEKVLVQWSEFGGPLIAKRPDSASSADSPDKSQAMSSSRAAASEAAPAAADGKAAPSRGSRKASRPVKSRPFVSSLF